MPRPSMKIDTLKELKRYYEHSLEKEGKAKARRLEEAQEFEVLLPFICLG